MSSNKLNSLTLELQDAIDSLVNYSELLNIGIDCCTYHSLENHKRLRLLVNTYISNFDSQIEEIQNTVSNLRNELSKQLQGGN